MSKQVLVAFSSKHGATKEIAERIGERLRSDGLAATVAEVGDVAAVADYDAVVLGSAVYFGQWRKEAVKFARQNRAALAAKPVWLFSSGPLNQPSLEDPKPVPELRAELGPVDHRVFAGALDAKKLSIPEKIVIAAVRSQTKLQDELTGDFRSWPEIEEWTDGIAEALFMQPAIAR
jgi:menaquinone-dependent protoporphyrinogen oxidase